MIAGYLSKLKKPISPSGHTRRQQNYIESCRTVCIVIMQSLELYCKFFLILQLRLENFDFSLLGQILLPKLKNLCGGIIMWHYLTLAYILLPD